MATPEPLSSLTAYTTYHTTDEVMILDTVDTTMASTGTDKRIAFSTLLTMAGAAVNSTVVHLEGGETITGSKTFSSSVKSTSGVTISGGYGAIVSASDLVLGGVGTSPHSGSIGFGDGTGWLLDFGPKVDGVFAPVITFTDTGNGSFAGRLGVNGATPPAKASSPGSASGSDATVINAITTILRNLGFCN